MCSSRFCSQCCFLYGFSSEKAAQFNWLTGGVKIKVREPQLRILLVSNVSFSLIECLSNVFVYIGKEIVDREGTSRDEVLLHHCFPTRSHTRSSLSCSTGITMHTLRSVIGSMKERRGLERSHQDWSCSGRRARDVDGGWAHHGREERERLDKRDDEE